MFQKFICSSDKCEGKDKSISAPLSLLDSSLECVRVKSLQSCPVNSATLWTVTCQAPLSMGFSRQEYWSGLLCPTPGDPPGDLPNPGIEHTSLTSPALAGVRGVRCYHLGSPHALAGGFFTTSTTWDSSLTSILILTEGESKSLSTV